MSLPNFHPLVLHFPIVLICLGLMSDFLLLFRKNEWVQKAAPFFYILGTLALWGTFITGRMAADGMSIPSDTLGALADHADRAWWASIITSAFMIMRLGLSALFKPQPLLVRMLFALGASVTFGLIAYTADAGGLLVYTHGLGVSKAKAQVIRAPEPSPPEPIPAEKPILPHDLHAPWNWEAGSIDNSTLFMGFRSEKEFPFVGTVASRAILETQHRVDWGAWFPESMENAIVSLSFDTTAWKGEMVLFTKYKSPKTYDAVRISEESASLIRLQDGKETVLQEAPFQKGRHQVLVSAHGSHFRFEVDGKLLLHGHKSPLSTPTVPGVKFVGQGSIKLFSMRIEKLN